MTPNQYMILRVLSQLPPKRGATSGQIGQVITDLNKIWVVSKYSIASHMGTLRKLGYVRSKKIYDREQKPFYNRRTGCSHYPYHVEWKITERGQYVLDGSAI